MSDEKHTPGPWVVDGPPENQIVWSDAENRICFLAHSAGRDEDRDYANGRLIAAAPDLLAACKALYAQHKPGKGQCCEAADMALAAISKAEGSV